MTPVDRNVPGDEQRGAGAAPGDGSSSTTAEDRAAAATIPQWAPYLAVVVAAVFVSWSVIALLHSASGRGLDLSIYLGSAREFLAHGDPYAFLSSRNRLLGFTYPPIAIYPFALVARVPDEVAWALWIPVIILVSIALVVVWCSRAIGTSSRRYAVVVGALFLASEPIVRSIWLGQISPLIGALTVLSLMSLTPRTGIFCGLGAALKITPITAIGAYMVQPGGRRRAIWAVATFAALSGLGWLLLPDVSRKYWLHLLWDSSRVGPIKQYVNNSLAGMLSLMGVPTHNATLLGYALCGAAGVALWWFVVRGRTVGPIEAVIFIAGLTLLAVPVSWSHHAAPLTLVATSLAVRCSAERGWNVVVVWWARARPS